MSKKMMLISESMAFGLKMLSLMREFEPTNLPAIRPRCGSHSEDAGFTAILGTIYLRAWRYCSWSSWWCWAWYSGSDWSGWGYRLAGNPLLSIMRNDFPIFHFLESWMSPPFFINKNLNYRWYLIVRRILSPLFVQKRNVTWCLCLILPSLI